MGAGLRAYMRVRACARAHVPVYVSVYLSDKPLDFAKVMCHRLEVAVER